MGWTARWWTRVSLRAQAKSGGGNNRIEGQTKKKESARERQKFLQAAAAHRLLRVRRQP